MEFMSIEKVTTQRRIDLVPLSLFQSVMWRAALNGRKWHYVSHGEVEETPIRHCLDVIGKFPNSFPVMNKLTGEGLQ